MVDLSQGLLIENQNLLIPWDITNEEAWRIGNPKPFNLPNDKTRMMWSEATILNGLECIVQTYFPAVDSRLSTFNILDLNHEKHSPDIWADTLRACCRKLFGESKDGKWWWQDRVSFEVGHDNRFVEAYWLKIKKA